jgi:hypothetical protein
MIISGTMKALDNEKHRASVTFRSFQDISPASDGDIP